MELCGRAEAIVMQVHRLLAKVALVPVRSVVAAHAGEAVAGVEPLELLRAYLVYVDLAEVDVVDGPHRFVQIGGEDVGTEAEVRVVQNRRRPAVHMLEGAVSLSEVEALEHDAELSSDQAELVFLLAGNLLGQGSVVTWEAWEMNR